MRCITLLFLLILVTPTIAQSDSTKTSGEILTGEVIIEKEKKIILPLADKIFLRSQLKSFDNSPLNLSFDVSEPDFEWPDYKSDVPFQVNNSTYPEASYQNYVKLGYGNFNSPLIEAGLFKSIRNWDNRAILFYERFKTGPVNGENSGNADGGIDVSSTYKKENWVVIPSISYIGSSYNFYGNANRVNTGFDSSEPDEGNINNFKTNIKIGWNNDDVEAYITPIFTNTAQTASLSASDNSESVIGVDAGLEFKIDDSFTAGLNINGRTSTYKGGLTYDRSLLNINPNLVYKKDALRLDIGFMVSSSNVNEVSNTSIYPRLKGDYKLSESWSIFGKVEGGITWNSLNRIITENNFLDDSLLIVNTESKLVIGGGLEGNPIENMFLSISITNSSLNGLPFFISSAQDSSKYSLTYDSESVNLFSLNSSISFMPNAVSNYGASLMINSFGLTNLDRPWHKPAYILKAYTSHNIKEKLIVSAYFTSMGGIRGPANVNFGYVKLAPFIDAGLGAKYLLTPRSSVFIDVNNLLNDEYERYLGYPIRGLAFKIGGQYRF
ncbi:hypothetical protein [Ekhidna sp.]|uniref:hypothetical protein n=1 Tax=Ekhidna sp. TaxID=2608089 RepID=UPI003B50DCC0